jgi:uncharacterized membrane protein YqhA
VVNRLTPIVNRATPLIIDGTMRLVRVLFDVVQWLLISVAIVFVGLCAHSSFVSRFGDGLVALVGLYLSISAAKSFEWIREKLWSRSRPLMMVLVTIVYLSLTLAFTWGVYTGVSDLAQSLLKANIEALRYN